MPDFGADFLSLLDARIELKLNELLKIHARTPRTIRIAAGFRTATALAEAAGVTKAYISRIENGLVRSLGIRSGGPLDRIVRVLGCTPEEYRLAAEALYQSRRAGRLEQKELDVVGIDRGSAKLGRGKIAFDRGAGPLRGVRSTA